MNLDLTKEQQLIIIGLILSLIIGLGITAYQNLSSRNKEIKIETPSTEVRKELLIHISGAVIKEGVYKLKEGDRVMDAIELAGGALRTADLSQINLAEKIKDGAKIYIPAIMIMSEPQQDEISVQNRKASKKNDPIKPININIAGQQEIDSLPGIGDSFAKKIIEYRKSKGRITKIEQLLEIPRFGKSRLEKIKSRIIL
ncbi:MAG: helix-hairpin-helix domain-containing protein [Candidatus Margulisiibacteriota bacterium]